MECPNCHQTIEAGPAFCGNCGQPLNAPAGPNEAAYALARPAQHVGEDKALGAVICGVFGLVGSLFMPLIGLSLGTAGAVLATSARSQTKRRLTTVGLVFSSLAIMAGLATWT